MGSSSWSQAASEVVWLQNLLKIMGLQQSVTPLMLCDSLSAVCLTANPMFHKRTKHFDIDYHYVRERVALKALEVKHIPARLQLADVFIKSLAQEPFFRLRNKLGVSFPPTPSLREGIKLSGENTSSQAEGISFAKTPTQPKALKTDHILAVKALTVTSRQMSNKRPCCQKCTKMTAKGILTSNRFGCLDSCAIIS